MRTFLTKSKNFNVRGPIVWFSQMMERKCRTHDADRGKFGWRGNRVRSLLHRVVQEYYEALLADHDAHTDTMSEDPEKLEALLWECVDIGNMAMMAADNVRLKMQKKDIRDGNEEDE